MSKKTLQIESGFSDCQQPTIPLVLQADTNGNSQPPSPAIWSRNDSEDYQVVKYSKLPLTGNPLHISIRLLMCC